MADCQITLSYQTGAATYATMKSPFGFWLLNSVYRKNQATKWETEVKTVTQTFGTLAEGVELTFDDTADSTEGLGEKEFTLTEMKATKIEVKSGNTLIYVRNY